MEDGSVREQKRGISIRLTLLLFAIIPLIVGTIVNTIYLIESSKRDTTNQNHMYMVTLAEQADVAFNDYILNGEETVRAFTKSPIVLDLLKDPTNEELKELAQKYTVDYFNELDNWEGIYISSWDTVCLTHPNPNVCGVQFRDGSYRQDLWDSMLASTKGIYNTGIIESPASGDLIISMYAPVFDENNKPLGYVGAGTYVTNISSKVSNVSSLDLESAYIYIVDGHSGMMISHPDPEKIGKPVENAAVTQVVSDINAKKHPTNDVITYDYKGSNKYAAYCVAADESYVIVLTANESDVMAATNAATRNSIILAVVLIGVFVGIALWLAHLIGTPFVVVTKAVNDMADGNLDADLDNIMTHVSETISLVESSRILKSQLNSVIGQTKLISSALINDANTVNRIATTCSDEAAGITNAVDDIANGATVLAEEVQSINSQVITINQNVEDISATAEHLVSLSTDIKNANTDAKQYIDKVQDSSKQSAKAIEDIQRQVNETNEAIIKIKDAVEIIKQVASQTNLLSLNASIEAARAGESGKGFAVVAHEIGDLSAQSNSSAEKIDTIVRDIIDKAEKLVALSSNVSSYIHNEQQCIIETHKKFANLNSNIESSLVEIDSIDGKVSSLSDAALSITHSVTDLSALSEENVASTQEVAASITSVSNELVTIKENSDKTKTNADSLSNTIAYFN